MTYQQLLAWLVTHADQWSKNIPVVLRIDAGGESTVGGLCSVSIDAGCTDDDALVLEGTDRTEEFP